WQHFQITHDITSLTIYIIITLDPWLSSGRIPANRKGWCPCTTTPCPWATPLHPGPPSHNSSKLCESRVISPPRHSPQRPRTTHPSQMKLTIKTLEGKTFDVNVEENFSVRSFPGCFSSCEGAARNDLIRAAGLRFPAVLCMRMGRAWRLTYMR